MHHTQDGKVLFYFRSVIHKNDLFIECFHASMQHYLFPKEAIVEIFNIIHYEFLQYNGGLYHSCMILLYIIEL